MSILKYLKTAITDYQNVASPFPTSKYTIRKIIKHLKPDHKFIVEYGPGDGAVTKEILKHLPKDGKLIVIEINKDFVEELKKINDDRLTVLSDDVRLMSQKIKDFGLPSVDAVISGIPFSYFKKDIRLEIIKNTYDGLREGGVFIPYQTTPSLVPILKTIFKDVKYKFEPLNFVPYFVMIAEK